MTPTRNEETTQPPSPDERAFSSTLQQVPHKFNSKLDQDDALSAILDEAIQAIGAERGSLWLTNPATGALEIRLGRGRAPSLFSSNATEYSRTVIERSWRTGTPVLTANVVDDPELSGADSVMNRTLRSILCVPLHSQGQRIGVLCLDNRLKPGQFREDDVKLAVAIAGQAAIALHNAELYAAAQHELAERQRVELEISRRNQELALLNQASQAFNSLLDLDQVLATVLEEVCRLLSALAISIWLVDSQTHELVCRQATGPWRDMMRGFRFPLGRGLVGWVASTGESAIAPDVQSDGRFRMDMIDKSGLTIRSALCVPLRTRRGVIGAIQFLDSEIDRFSSTDLSWVQALASSAATAIENAQLYARIRELTVEQERQRLARELHDTVTQSLYSMGMAAQASLKLLEQGDTGDQVRDSVQYILELSQTALTDIREQLYQLRPTILSDKGLVEALAQHCHTLRTKHLLPIQVIADQEPPLTMVQRETLLCAAREALWNVVRRARATHVSVSLTTAQDQVILCVEDDGVGFEPSVLAQEEAIGLANIDERVKAVSGTSELHSDPLHGTRVIVRMPLLAQENEKPLSN